MAGILAALAVYAGPEALWLCLIFAGGAISFLTDAWRRKQTADRGN
ncbi:hypothetical protein ACFWCB_05425 [Streptomyces sp. NPDC060048]